MAGAYTVELVTPETPHIIIEQLFARSSEIIHLDAEKVQYCGGVEDVDDLFPQIKSVGGGPDYDRDDFYIQRRYVALDPIAGVVGYCDIRYPVTKERNAAFAIYDDKSPERPGQDVMIVFVALSCSFTMSNERVGDKSVREIIADKKKADASLPNAGKFITQEIGRQLLDEFEVDRVIFVLVSIDSAEAQHRKNGGKFFKEVGFSIFGALTSRVTKGNVFDTFLKNAMSSNEFLFSDDADDLVKTLEDGGFYVVYPPPAGGRRRRSKKTLRRRRRTYKKKTARRRL